jgi:hypothetical protein
VVKLGRYDLPVVHPLNLPPPLGTSNAGPTQISILQCPSAPTRTINYGPILSQSIVIPLGYTDYGPVRGFNPTQTTCSTGAQLANDSGVFGRRTTFPKVTDQTLQTIADGTSNTLLVVETAGRQMIYLKGKPTPNPARTPNPYPGARNAWADAAWGVLVRGSDPTTGIVGAGCCVINCTNDGPPGASPGEYEIYGFHSGGVMGLRGDGSVQFMRDSMAPGVLGALISAKGGEVFQEN